VNFIAASILSRQVRTVEPAPNALALPRAIPRAVSNFSESQLMTEVGCSCRVQHCSPTDGAPVRIVMDMPGFNDVAIERSRMQAKILQVAKCIFVLVPLENGMNSA
jgi:hypothetical protein